MLADYHIHTSLCGHAEGSPEEYVSAAQKSCIQEICFTDHAPNPDDYDPGNRMTLERFPEYSQLVSSIQKQAPDMTILYGIEADYYQGCETFLEPWLKENAFDLVIGSVHYIEEWGFDNPTEKKTWKSANVSDVWQHYFALLAELADTGLYDIIGHLDLPKKFRYRPPDTELERIAAPVLDKIAEAGMAVELNTGGLRKAVKEIYPSLPLLKMTRARDIPICFGSDAHIPSQVGQEFNMALKLAKDAGYSECVRYRKRKKESLPLP